MRRGKVSRRFSRQEICALSGATPAELERFERIGLLVPNVDWWPPWQHHEPYFDEDQLEVLRWLVDARRMWQRCQGI